jgi:hydroxymethylbilane synthase
MQTSGDRQATASLLAIGGQGVFTKEIQQALVNGIIEVAVHSLKDLPTEPVPGLVLAAVPPRGPTADVFVGRTAMRCDELPQGATVATSSARRRAQLWHRRPDLQLVEMRGNVDTRLRKLEDQQLDGLILAKAGLCRLGLEHVITEELDAGWMLPAVGQGALGLECRADDQATRALLARLNDSVALACVTAERALLRRLGGGCQLPIAGLATCDGQALRLRGAVLTPDGRQRLDGEAEGILDDATALGVQLGEDLLRQGAARLLGQS